METRFAFLHQRDTSVSMLRVKMSRRRSQSQKENREKVFNLRRRLEDLPEQELSLLEKSIAVHEQKVAQTKAAKTGNDNAVEERKKMLARYKEAKELQKEKERREKEKKGVFKCGLYQPRQPVFTNPQAPSKAKNPEPVLSTRVTRSMKQPRQTPIQPPQQKTVPQKSAPKKEAVVRRPLSTRGQPRVPVAAVPTTASKPKAPAVEPVSRATRTTRTTAAAKPSSDAKTANSKTRSAVKQQKVPPAGLDQEQKEDSKEMTQCNEQKEEESYPAEPSVPAMEDPVQAQVEAEAETETAAPSSFAPQGFVFQAPAGLSAFQAAPLSPSSASALTFSSFEAKPESSVTMDSPTPPSAAPSSPSPSIPAAPPSPIPPISSASAPPASAQPPSSSSSSPSPSPPPPPCADATTATATADAVADVAAAAVDCGSAAPPSVQQEEQHGVPYFRAVLVSETERLTLLAEQWQVHFDDSSIPEEMRDRMRTAVGQARLLMKERFGQFRGLVDDCEFSRGEKVTTCTDLQGFWDMVYFQVEDVDRKFVALKEAEGRGWTEEKKAAAAPRQKKLVKKPPIVGAAGRPGAGAAGNAAAKSRLAAIKAAMKAKQQQAEAEKAAQAAASVPDTTPAATSATPSKLQPADKVVFNGGFFQVESPLKTAESVRRSSRLSVVPAASPRPAAASPIVTPIRHRRSTAPLHASPLTRMTPVTTPARLPAPSPSPACTPQPSIPPPSSSSSSSDPDPTSVALSFSPERTCPTSLSRLSPPPPAPDRSPSASGSSSVSEAAPTEPPRSPPSLLISSPSRTTEQHLTTADPHSSPAVAVAVSMPTDVDMSVSPQTPCTENAPGLDFERYLQTTSPAVSMSPHSPQDVPIETFSPMTVDAEMESPEAPRLDALQQTPTALPPMSPLFTPHMAQPVDSNLLLFTPELKDRVRQSVCERDLMMFTPPTHK